MQNCREKLRCDDWFFQYPPEAEIDATVDILLEHLDAFERKGFRCVDDICRPDGTGVVLRRG